MFRLRRRRQPTSPRSTLIFYFAFLVVPFPTRVIWYDGFLWVWCGLVSGFYKPMNRAIDNGWKNHLQLLKLAHLQLQYPPYSHSPK
jgi:hypothetical protein